MNVLQKIFSDPAYGSEKILLQDCLGRVCMMELQKQFPLADKPVKAEPVQSETPPSPSPVPHNTPVFHQAKPKKRRKVVPFAPPDLTEEPFERRKYAARNGNGHISTKARKLRNNERAQFRSQFDQHMGMIPFDLCVVLQRRMPELSVYQINGYMSRLHEEVAAGITLLPDIEAYKEWMYRKYPDTKWALYNSERSQKVREYNQGVRERNQQIEEQNREIKRYNKTADKSARRKIIPLEKYRHLPRKEKK